MEKNDDRGDLVCAVNWDYFAFLCACTCANLSKCYLRNANERTNKWDEWMQYEDACGKRKEGGLEKHRTNKTRVEGV